MLVGSSVLSWVLLCSRALVLRVFFGLALVVPMYTSCVLRGALRFL